MTDCFSQLSVCRFSAVIAIYHDKSLSDVSKIYCMSKSFKSHHRQRMFHPPFLLLFPLKLSPSSSAKRAAFIAGTPSPPLSFSPISPTPLCACFHSLHAHKPKHLQYGGWTTGIHSRVRRSGGGRRKKLCLVTDSDTLPLVSPRISTDDSFKTKMADDDEHVTYTRDPGRARLKRIK